MEGPYWTTNQCPVFKDNSLPKDSPNAHLTSPVTGTVTKNTQECTMAKK